MILSHDDLKSRIYIIHPAACHPRAGAQRSFNVSYYCLRFTGIFGLALLRIMAIKYRPLFWA